MFAEMTLGQILAEAALTILRRGATVEQLLQVIALERDDRGHLFTPYDSAYPEDCYAIFDYGEGVGWTYAPGTAQARDAFVEVAP